MGQARCPAHTKQKRAERGTFRQRGYSWAEWDGPSGLRTRHLAAHPLCAPCGEESPARVVAATVVDHRIAWQSGKTEEERRALKLDPTNLVSMCASCHGKKTALEDGSFGRMPGPR